MNQSFEKIIENLAQNCISFLKHVIKRNIVKSAISNLHLIYVLTGFHFLKFIGNGTRSFEDNSFFNVTVCKQKERICIHCLDVRDACH